MRTWLRGMENESVPDLESWERAASQNAVSRDLLKSYERGLYEHCALHAGDPHWGGMIAERKP